MAVRDSLYGGGKEIGAAIRGCEGYRVCDVVGQAGQLEWSRACWTVRDWAGWVASVGGIDDAPLCPSR